MRVLLDECVPRRLTREIVGHDVRTVPQEGWSGKKNGELLRLMSAAGFEVLLTVDQGIRHQQNLRAAGVAVVVMVGASNRLADLVPLVPDVLVALSPCSPAMWSRSVPDRVEEHWWEDPPVPPGRGPRVRRGILTLDSHRWRSLGGGRGRSLVQSRVPGWPRRTRTGGKTHQCHPVERYDVVASDGAINETVGWHWWLLPPVRDHPGHWWEDPPVPPSRAQIGAA